MFASTLIPSLDMILLYIYRNKSRVFVLITMKTNNVQRVLFDFAAEV